MVRFCSEFNMDFLALVLVVVQILPIWVSNRLMAAALLDPDLLVVDFWSSLMNKCLMCAQARSPLKVGVYTYGVNRMVNDGIAPSSKFPTWIYLGFCLQRAASNMWNPHHVDKLSVSSAIASAGKYWMCRRPEKWSPRMLACGTQLFGQILPLPHVFTLSRDNMAEEDSCSRHEWS